MRLIVSRNSAYQAALAHQPERRRGPLLVDDFLRIIEAAAALRLRSRAGVGLLGRRSAGASGLADFVSR